MAALISRRWCSLTLLLCTWLLLFAGDADAQLPFMKKTRAGALLQQAREAYAQGDYEKAAGLYVQVEGRKAELSPAEQGDLSTQTQQNTQAMQLRREGELQLKRAEEALIKNEKGEATALLKALVANQYLSAADKARFATLAECLRDGTSPKTDARALLTDARAALQRGDLALAERLAGQAEKQEGASGFFTWMQPWSDSPAKVRRDVQAARAKPPTPPEPGKEDSPLTAMKNLLGQKTTANQQPHDVPVSDIGTSGPTKEPPGKDGQKPALTLVNKETPTELAITAPRPQGAPPPGGLARQLIEDGYKALAKDDLTQALKLAQQAQTLQPKLSWWERTPEKLLADIKAHGPAAREPKQPAPSGVQLVQHKETSTDQARRLIQEGYNALKANDPVRARKHAEQARELKPDLRWWEDNPEKLLADVDRQAPLAGGMPKPAPPGSDKADPRLLLRQAREQYVQGQYEDADKMCNMASLVPGTKWGLFEDTPDKLRREIQTARGKRDRDEAQKLLAEGRKLFADGKLEQAKETAWKAKNKMGAASIWDFGDRPERLLTEIETAEAAKKLTERDQPQVIEIPIASGPAPMKEPARDPGAVTVPPAVAGVPLERQRVLALLAEARQLEQANRLLEARGKALEARQATLLAQKAGVTFGPEEDNAESTLGRLAGQCDQRIKLLMFQAEQQLSAQPNDPQRFAPVLALLQEARALAAGFQFNPSVINDKLAFVQVLQNGAIVQAPMLVPPANPLDTAVPSSGLPNVVVPTAPGVPGVAGTKREEGLRMLTDANNALRAGRIQEARKIGEIVYSGDYGLQDQARTLLNMLDTEEAAQKALVHNRNVDAMVDEITRGRYAQAYNIAKGIDPNMLSPKNKARFHELARLPEMQPDALARNDKLRSGPDGDGKQRVGPGFGMDVDPSGKSGEPGKAVATNNGVKTPSLKEMLPGAGVANALPAMEQIKGMEDILKQKLRKETLEVQKKALELVKVGDYQRAIDVLTDCTNRLAETNLDPESINQLRRPLDKRAQDYATLKHQAKMMDEQKRVQKGGFDKISKKQEAQQKREKELSDLMAEYQQLYKEGKYKEAKGRAKMVLELDPDNAAANMGWKLADMKYNMVRDRNLKEDREERFLRDLDFEVGPSVTGDNPVAFNNKVTDQARKRNGYSKFPIETRSAKERSIEQKLLMPVSFNFKDIPLEKAVNALYDMSGINVVPDREALRQAGVGLDQPLTLRVDDLSLKSALNMLLKQAKLTYVIRDEALQITTPDHAASGMKTVTYPVADLVVPVENYAPPAVMDLQATLSRLNDVSLGGARGGVRAYDPMMGAGNGTPVSAGAPSAGGPGSSALGGYSQNGPVTNVTKTGAKGTMEDKLIRLITTVVAPESWSELGGKGTIQYYPHGMGLVVNQQQDVQEQVFELLQALRKLQDLQVAIEMRLVAVSESFFERMGMDFDVNITTPNSRFIPQLLSGQFQPAGFVNRMIFDHFVTGLTPAGTFTPDLNIPLKNSSFDFTIPPVGGYPGTLGADGGLSLGLAFLSDIQVFMFMEAAQGDRRANAMQAPRVTVFNGQQAFISVQDSQFFLTGININTAGDQLFFTPQNTAFPIGVNMQVQPVVSADRRFVRLALSPTLTNMVSANVPLIPVQIPVPQLFQDGITSQQPVIFQMFFQQPAFQTITVNTTVTVPDGGTVLLGGLKVMTEVRNEFGPPILSKIPYLNRLFRNVGFGRDGSSLMIMVTPRIIISEEEEQIHLGQIPPLPRP